MTLRLCGLSLCVILRHLGALGTVCDFIFGLGSKSGSSESKNEKKRRPFSVMVVLGRWEHCGVSLVLVLFLCDRLVVEFGRLLDVLGVGIW